jgi:hypothetical protein
MKTITVIEDGKEYEVKIHSDSDGLPGDVYWLLNGKCHREKGPAQIEYTGYRAWRQNDVFHRLDGPAIIWGDNHRRWWINDKPTTKQKHTKVRTMLALKLDKI